MGAPLSVGIGVVGSLYGASKAARSQRRAANELAQMAEPYLAEGRFALPKLRLLAESYYAPRVGKMSPLLRAQHGQNLFDLGRANTRSLASIRHAYAGTGNMGRARGEQLRLADQVTHATNRENLSYGAAQQSYLDAVAGQYQEILQRLAALGSQGLSYGSQAAKLRGAAGAGFWNTFGQLFGAKGAGAEWLGQVVTPKSGAAPPTPTG
jgi:hypothetical protein